MVPYDMGEKHFVQGLIVPKGHKTLFLKLPAKC